MTAEQIYRATLVKQAEAGAQDAAQAANVEHIKARLEGARTDLNQALEVRKTARRTNSAYDTLLPMLMARRSLPSDKDPVTFTLDLLK